MSRRNILCIAGATLLIVIALAWKDAPPANSTAETLSTPVAIDASAPPHGN